MELSLITLSAAAALTGLAAYTDLKRQRIPNWLTAPAAALGLVYHALAPDGSGAPFAALGLAVGLALLLLPALLGGSGMGDVKLLGALGAWLGVQRLLAAFVASVFLAAFLAVAVLGWSALSQGLAKTRGQFIGAGMATAGAPVAARRVLPFAIPVALATWTLVLGWGLLWQH